MSSSASYADVVKQPTAVMHNPYDARPFSDTLLDPPQYTQTKSQQALVKLLPKTSVSTSILQAGQNYQSIQFDLSGADCPHFIREAYLGFTVANGNGADSITIVPANCVQNMYSQINERQICDPRPNLVHLVSMFDNYTKQDLEKFLTLGGFSTSTYSSSATLAAGASATYFIKLQEPFSEGNMPTFIDTIRPSLKFDISGQNIKQAGNAAITDLTVSDMALYVRGWVHHPSILDSIRKKYRDGSKYFFKFFNITDYTIPAKSVNAGTSYKDPLNGTGVSSHIIVVASDATDRSGDKLYQSLGIRALDTLYQGGLSQTKYQQNGIPQALVKYALGVGNTLSDVALKFNFYKLSFNTKPLETAVTGASFGYQKLDTNDRLLTIPDVTNSNFQIDAILFKYGGVSVNFASGEFVVFSD